MHVLILRLDRPIDVPRVVLHPQHDHEAGTRVFGVEVDLAARQGVGNRLRVAEVDASFNGHAALLQGGCVDLRNGHVLGEVFRADTNRAFGAATAVRENQCSSGTSNVPGATCFDSERTRSGVQPGSLVAADAGGIDERWPKFLY